LETLRPLLLIVSSRAWLRFMLRLGMPGLFLMSALDSSFLVLPFGTAPLDAPVNKFPVSRTVIGSSGIPQWPDPRVESPIKKKSGGAAACQKDVAFKPPRR
jgi:hypothetical protein